MLVGVVGKANVGKSTFFKAATLADVEIANYPFATIKPNSGIGYVRVQALCKELGVTCNPREGFCKGGIRYVPINMMDVAGLVPGAHEGKGMGNQFLEDLRQADVLVHVVDVSGSTNEKGEPVEPGSYDPAEDVRFLETELDYWYRQILKKGWDKFAREVQQQKREIHKELAKQLSAMKVSEDMVHAAMKAHGLDPFKVTEWTDDDLLALASDFRSQTKPMVIACNKVDVPGADDRFKRLKEEFPDHMLVPCSSESELALREAAKHGLIDYAPGAGTFTIKSDKLTDKQSQALRFIKDTILGNWSSTGVQDVLDKAVFELLKYIAIFPGGVNKLEDQHGNVLPDCFLMPSGSTPLDFAYRIHTDLGDKFIKAIDVRTKMPVAKDVPLKHRDVIEIMTS